MTSQSINGINKSWGIQIFSCCSRWIQGICSVFGFIQNFYKIRDLLKFTSWSRVEAICTLREFRLWKTNMNPNNLWLFQSKTTIPYGSAVITPECTYLYTLTNVWEIISPVIVTANIFTLGCQLKTDVSNLKENGLFKNSSFNAQHLTDV